MVVQFRQKQQAMQTEPVLPSVRERLENAIVDGRFTPGEKLDLEGLAQEFGCSRTPIREASQQLEMSGLVRIVAKRGTFVAELGVEELTERFEVMAELESMCARLAARRISNEELITLEAEHETCSHLSETNDVDGYYHQNSLFHACIYRASHNAFLEQEALRLHAILQPYRRMQLRLRNRLKQSLMEHEAIVTAIRAGDADAAMEAMRDHVLIQGDRFRDLVSLLRRYPA